MTESPPKAIRSEVFVSLFIYPWIKLWRIKVQTEAPTDQANRNGLQKDLFCAQIALLLCKQIQTFPANSDLVHGSWEWWIQTFLS